MARLDSYEGYPEGMVQYLSYYGWHFSKKMSDWAAGNMYKFISGKKVYITPYSKEKLDEMLANANIKVKGNIGYDACYVANMCRADFLGSSIKGEAELVKYVGDVINDPDAYEGMVFTRFYADCVGSGTPIIWEDML